MSNNPYQEEITHGEELYQQGQIDEALQVLEEVLENDPKNVEALNDLAVITSEETDFDSSARYLLTAFNIDPSHPDVLANIESLIEKEEIHQHFVTYTQELRGKQKASRESRQSLSYLSRILNIPTEYQAAVVNLDITPKINEGESILLQGFAGAPRQAKSAITPLNMQVLLLEDQNYNHSLFVTADIFGFDESMVSQVRQALQPWGISPEQIILNASHTHYAPGTVSNVPEILGPYYKSYASAIVNTIVQSLDSLYSSLEPCLFYAGQTNAKIGVNRRLKRDNQVVFGVNSNGYYEEHTPFLFVDFIKTSKSLVLVNHGCHPTGYNALDQISADFPIYMREFLKKSPEIDEVMFLQGAAGTSKEAIGQNGSTKFTSNPGEVALNGQQLANAIQDALSKDLSCVTGHITGAIQNTTLSLENIPTRDEIDNYLNGDAQNALVKSWAQYFRQNSNRLTGKISLEVQQFNIGKNVAFVTLPGEPVAELGQKILGRFPEEATSFILGYTNGLTAYLPTAEQVAEGGYESDTSKYAYNLPGSFSADIEEQILSTVQSLLSTSEQNINGKKFTQKTGKAFFTLSSGRCGTKTLSHLLNTATNAKVYHHPRPYLVNETLQAYHNNIDKSEAFWRARKSVIQDAWEDDLIFGELDHNMTPFVPAIAEDIQDAKFIVLVRNPWDFVRSGMRRNYYNGHPWDSGRLRPEPTHPDFERWQTMSQFEKVCWLWNETYTRIQSYLEDIPDDQYRIVKFEELVKDPKITEDVFEFLGLEGFEEDKISSILSTPMNKQTAGDFPKAEVWDNTLYSSIQNECESMISAYEYDDLKKKYQKPTVDQLFTKQNTTYTDKQTLLFLEQEGLSTGGHLDHIVPGLQDEFNVNFFKTANLQDAQKAIEDADIVWLEWASQLTALVTQKVSALQNKPVLCRLHGFEVFTDLPAKINWDVVDQLIFVANHKKEIFNQRFPDANVRQTVIRNGINIDAFSIPEQKENTKNLLLLGHINYRKGLTLLIQYYYELLKRDPEFHLYIRGDWQDLRYKMAVMTMVQELNLEKDITFVEGWIEDLNSWLADKSHILSFSLEESFHYAIGNGMAAGMKPVIHAWNESREIWPNEFIFRNLDEFIRLVKDENYTPNQYKGILSDNGLNAENQIKNILENLNKTAAYYKTNSENGADNSDIFNSNIDYWTNRYTSVGGKRTVGHINWDESTYNHQTSIINKIVKKQLAKISNEKSIHKVLDFGCGIARFSDILLTFANQYYGVDVVENVILKNNRIFQNVPRKKFGVIRENRIPDFDVNFDLIFSSFVMQHILDDDLLKYYGQQFENLLSNDGYLVLLENLNGHLADEGHMRYRSITELNNILSGFELEVADQYLNKNGVPHTLLIGKKTESNLQSKNKQRMRLQMGLDKSHSNTKEPATTNNTKKHIVIIGLKRSGTTIFWNSLRKDDQFLCFDEPFHPKLQNNIKKKLNNHKSTLTEYFRYGQLIEQFWSPVLPKDEIHDQLTTKQSQYLKQLFSLNDNLCVDFVRCHTKLHEIRRLIPEALIIHLVRDPRAFVTSHLKPYGNWISESLPENFFHYADWFDYWSYQSLAGKAGIRGNAIESLLQIWKYFTNIAEGQNPDITIQFEEFATKPDQILKHLYSYLNIPFQEKSLNDIHLPNKPHKVNDSQWEKYLEKYAINKFVYDFT